MVMKRRHFLGGMLATGILPAFGAPESERIARIGMMTDTHIGKTLESCSRVKAALELFKSKGVEMVINCGDLADRHYPDGYRFYRQTVNTVYPDAATRPKEVYVYAWHDTADYDAVKRDGPPGFLGAFENMRKLLEAPNPHTCDFVWKGLPFLVFPQFTGHAGFLSWADYEKAIERTCAANPGKPVFVCDHVPPADTIFHSREWGCEECRRILNRFPQVVSISGHVHGSLACERLIWQGQFTAINLGCLQTWGGFAPGSTPPRQAKPNFGVSVMDVYPDRLLIRRYDVRDGSEYSPDAPWLIPLPFVAAQAPYVPATAAKRCRQPVFAPDTTVKVTPVGSPITGYEIAFREAGAFMYRLRCERKTANGNWEPYSRDDIFGEFWKAPKDRAGESRYVLSAGFFNAGETYRISVSPLDFFYRESPAVTGTFTATHPPAKSLWSCADPMATLRFTEYGKAVERGTDGYFTPPSGQGTLNLPDGIFANLERGKRHHFTFDLDGIQPDGEWCAWRVTLRGRTGNRVTLADVQTSPGKPGTLRYVMDFNTPTNGDMPQTCDLLFNRRSPNSKLRVTRLELSRA